MSLSYKLRNFLINLTGYWIYKKASLPACIDLFQDVNHKLRLTPKVIFDIGANRGQSIQYFMEDKLFSEAKMYSFEPVSFSFEQLKANTAAYPNVHIEQLAFGSEKGQKEIGLHEGPASVMNSLKDNVMNNEEGAKKEVINITTLDEYVAEHNIDEIDFLKIDTEGFEIPVLEGAKKMLEAGKIKLIYCEVCFTDQSVRSAQLYEIADHLAPYGYYFYGLYKISHIQLYKGTHYGNALFVQSKLVVNY